MALATDSFGLSIQNETLQTTLDKANITTLAEALRLIKLGTHLTFLKVTFAGLTSAAAQVITSVANFALATVNFGPQYLTNGTGPTLPPALSVTALRVTAGAAVAGPRVVTDASGTAAAGATGLGGAPGGVALLSNDGTTLTFETTVTAIIVEYIPRPIASMTANFDDLNQEV